MLRKALVLCVLGTCVLSLAAEVAPDETAPPYAGLLAAPATEGDAPALQQLLPEATPKQRAEALLLAAAGETEGHVACVRALVGGGTDVLERDRTTRGTALHAAARASLASVELLLAARGGTGALTITDNHGWSPLYHAVRAGDKRAASVAALLAAGADVGVNDIAGFTPLHLAARHDGSAALRVLLRSNSFRYQAAKLLAQPNMYGETALALATRLQHRAAMKVLAEAAAQQIEEASAAAAQQGNDAAQQQQQQQGNDAAQQGKLGKEEL